MQSSEFTHPEESIITNDQAFAHEVAVQEEQHTHAIRRRLIGGASALLLLAACSGGSSERSSFEDRPTPTTVEIDVPDTEGSTLMPEIVTENHKPYLDEINKTDLHNLDTAAMPELPNGYGEGYDLYAKTVLFTLDRLSDVLKQDVNTKENAAYFLAQGYIELVSVQADGNEELLKGSPFTARGEALQFSGDKEAAQGAFQIDNYDPSEPLRGNYQDPRRLEMFQAVTGLSEVPVNLDQDKVLNIVMGICIGMRQLEERAMFNGNVFPTDYETYLAVGEEYGTLADNNPESPIKARLQRFKNAYDAVAAAYVD